ncbi:MAG: DegT/DnrJ/EryC1/StrS family aminotransferase [Cyclobacteriaceae bacterium]|jgi:dTDP-4-amino-4,6-dideoxygalactose transaminase|nr:DegT/DnrJ/EryC1/StrS family aminotransferase [Cyclobacteriaceae bacterium]
MSRPSIPLSFTPFEAPALAAVLNQYPSDRPDLLIQAFEERLKFFTGADHVVAVNSGTSALHLALRAVGVGPGDYVLAPTFTYVATIYPVLYLGARPFLIDSERETWNIDPQLVWEALASLKVKGIRPKALVVTHTYGGVAQMAKLLAIAEEAGLAVIEDAAESLGALFHGKPSGTLGDVGVFSFNNNKTFTTFGGGALVTNDAHVARNVRLWASQARENTPHYLHGTLGYNYRMSPLNAAYGLAQWPTFDSRLNDRRRVAERYGRMAGVEMQPEQTGTWHSRWLPALLLSDTQKLEFAIEMLDNQSIEYRRLWNPMHRQPVFADEISLLSGVADDLFSRGLCLPSGTNLAPADQDRVLRAVGG